MHVPSITPPALIAAAFLTGGCTTPAVPRGAPAPASYALQREAQAVLRALARERQDFLQHGTPVRVFAVFYYHVTAAILERAASGRLPQSAAILEMLAEFHADYARSRDAHTREPHWSAYYNVAAALSHHPLRWRDAVGSPRSLIVLGIRAHIDGDLPRCLARVRQRHPQLHPAEIEAAFRSLDSIFSDCAAAGFADLAARITDVPGPRTLAFQRTIARLIIQRKRHRAWQAALTAAQ